MKPLGRPATESADPVGRRSLSNRAEAAGRSQPAAQNRS